MALLRRLPISQVNHVPPTGLLSFIGLLVEAGSSNVNTKNLFKRLTPLWISTIFFWDIGSSTLDLWDALLYYASLTLLKGDQMARLYQQFLGSNPGILVELIDDSTSPYRVRTEDGFEFTIGSDDFRNYYRIEGEPTPMEWKHLITDHEKGLVDSRKNAKVMDIIRTFEAVFQDVHKARTFVRDALKILEEVPRGGSSELWSRLGEFHPNCAELRERDLDALAEVDQDIRALLLSETCAVIELPTGNRDDSEMPGVMIEPLKTGAATEIRSPNKIVGKLRQGGMKNVEMHIDGNILSILIDLSKEFGPSKSGKTRIVASTEGNKSLAGRDEKIGLNIYRQDSKKPLKGRRKTFKNVEMDLDKDVLQITVDLSKEFGASKSGKTTIVASTEGNQLVFGREEKIGLNVYRKAE